MLNFIEITGGAIKNLKGNKIRSFLTMFGIIIGISSVITMSSIGSGGQASIVGDLKKSGYGKFTVSIDKFDKNFRWKYLITDDLLEKLRFTKKFKIISPDITDRFGIKINNLREFSFLEVTTPEFEILEPVVILEGRGFLPFDFNSSEKNIIIDNLTAKQLFNSYQAAIGREIYTVKGRKGREIAYTIVGVMKNPVENFAKVLGETKIPRFSRIPLKTYEKIYSAEKGGYSKIRVEALNPDDVSTAMKEMKTVISDLTGASKLYEVRVENDGVESFDKILSTLNIFVTFVAGISLFVGGIGVMNIMLVSVIERTKEIGIRKAIGATNRDILILFLIESLILTVFGGIIGMIFGLILGNIIGFIIGIKPLFSLFYIIISILVSMSIGIVFGVVPAKKASKLNPIEALRSE